MQTTYRKDSRELLEKPGARAYIHPGDSPGRNEPTTGKILFRNVLHHLCENYCNGVVCMEHGISQKKKEGKARVVAACILIVSLPFAGDPGGPVT